MELMYDENTFKDKICCPDCGWIPEDYIIEQLLTFINDLQLSVNGKIKIIGGARCAKCNARNKFCKDEAHEHGTALDLKPPEDFTIEEFAQECEISGAIKIDINYDKNFIHAVICEEIVNEEEE